MATRTIPVSGLVSLFVRHRNAANLVMALMIIFGIFALGRINTSFFPQTEFPVITVSVSWPGASAEDVEANVLEIIEPEVRFLEGVDRVTSRAREGTGSLGIEYEQGSDLKAALRDVETAIDAITTLPEDADAPVVRQPTGNFDRVARLAVTGNFSENTLRFYAKKIRDDLIERGIAKITFVGLRARELRADVPQQELRRLDLTVEDISRRIAANSKDLPSGQMEGQVETQLRTLADRDTPTGLSTLEVKSFPSGEKVLLGDIADIREGFKDSEPQGFSEGVRSVQLTVERSERADTLRSHAVLQSYLEEIKGQLPEGLSVKVYDVRADALTERILLLVDRKSVV